VDLALNYDALIITGGSGAIPGFMFDRGLQSLILAFNDLGKPIMAECNGGLAVAQTVDPSTGRSILFGRAVTTHSWLDEYQTGWGWTNEFSADTDDFWTDGTFNLESYQKAESWNPPGVSGNPLIDSEALFKNAAGAIGVFYSPAGTPYSVVLDGNIITCRTTPDGFPGVLTLLAVLDGAPPLHGRFFINQNRLGSSVPSNCRQKNW
jgi:putative intracellular protease/amidase